MALQLDEIGFTVDPRHRGPLAKPRRVGTGLNWRYVAASAAGTAHEQTRTPCQDYAYTATASARDGTQYLIALASDGAGSALYSEAGSRLACESGGAFLLEYLSHEGHLGRSVLNQGLATACLEHIRSTLENAVSEMHGTGAALRDFACTLVGLVAGPKHALAFQIGDGAVVIRRNGELAPVFWPDAGEYANMTYFVTDGDAEQHLQIAQIDAPHEVSLLTDGLQRLALVFSTRQAHAPFFEPMFAVLRNLHADQCDSLNAQLASFLSSPAVNQRTDDDKTLILATRIGPDFGCEPEVACQ